MSTFFDKPSATRQLGLQVEDETFWVTGQILALHSPVFEAMLYGRFKESKSKTISLPDKKASDILEMLLCIFPTPKTKEVDDSNVDILLPLVDEYQMEDLKAKCENYLLRAVWRFSSRKEDILRILCTASKYGMTSLVKESASECRLVCTPEDILPILPQLAVKDIACVALNMANSLHILSHERGKPLASYSSIMCQKCQRVYSKDCCVRCKIHLCSNCIERRLCEGGHQLHLRNFNQAVEELMNRTKE